MPIFATPRRTARDHPYARPPLPETPEPKAPAATESHVEVEKRKPGRPTKGKPPLKVPRVEYLSTTDVSTPEVTPQKQDSDEYLPSTETETTESSSSEDTPAQVFTEMPKYLVFRSQLDILFQQCRQCGKPITKKERSVVGSMVKYTASCLDEHVFTWRSQPLIGHQPSGNIALAAAIVLSGNSYSKIHALAACLQMPFFSRTVTQRIQNKSVYPVIQEAWLAEKARLVSIVQGRPLIIVGDGRCDRLVFYPSAS